MADRLRPWPENSPGVVNPWLLMVTSKPPAWRDELVGWPEEGLTAGRPHEGFFYPDPLGFWAQVRKWAVTVVSAAGTAESIPDALAVTTVVHLGHDPGGIGPTLEVLEPRVVLFLDEPAWESAGMTVEDVRPLVVPDPFRPGQAYNGFWGSGPNGMTVGKAPQHPAAHNLYRWPDMERYLGRVPLT